MATLIIDTHNFITKLKSAGMAEEQAEAIVAGLKEIEFGNVATKEDIATVRNEISKLKSDLLMWLIPLLLGQIGVFALVVEFILKP